ncbi:MAG: GlsB/YeaQ/YmgE family stress response membrane protein, partial [Gemmatimonadales bacterium]
LAAGWLASKLMGGGSRRMLEYLVIGVIGAILGGWLFGVLGLSAGGLMGQLITALVGAAVLLFVLRALKRA